MISFCARRAAMQLSNGHENESNEVARLLNLVAQTTTAVVLDLVLRDTKFSTTTTAVDLHNVDVYETVPG
jgi:hypothetical protein